MRCWWMTKEQEIEDLLKRNAEQQRIIEASHDRNRRQRHELRCLLEINAWLWRRVFKGGRGMR